MHAVLRPGLRQCLQLDLAGIASSLPVEGLNGLHLLEAQEQMPFPREGLEGLVVERTDVDGRHGDLTIDSMRECLGVIRTFVHEMNEWIGKAMSSQFTGRGVVEVRHVVANTCSNRNVTTEKTPQGHLDGIRGWIHHTRQRMDFDHRGCGGVCASVTASSVTGLPRRSRFTVSISDSLKSPSRRSTRAH